MKVTASEIPSAWKTFFSVGANPLHAGHSDPKKSSNVGLSALAEAMMLAKSARRNMVMLSFKMR